MLETLNLIFIDRFIDLFFMVIQTRNVKFLLFYLPIKAHHQMCPMPPI